MSSYTSENMLMIHKPKCENNDIITIRTSLESHNHWKHHFHKNHKNFMKIYILGYMQTLKLIMTSVILVYVIKQLINISKSRYLMVIT